MNPLELLKYAGIGLGLILSGISIAVVLRPWTPWKVRADINRIDNTVEQLVRLVEIQVVLNVEPKDSVEYQSALAELRQMRRNIIPNS